MTILEAETLWSEQSADAALSDESMKSIIKESNTLDRRVFWRDIREWAATILVCALFIRVGILPGTPSLWYFSAAAVVTIPGIYMVFSRLKGKKEQEEPALSNCEHIESAIKKYRRQENLLNSVVVWYLAPLFVGALLFILGTSLYIPNMPVGAKVLLFTVQIGFCLVLFAAVAWLNFRASKKHLRPKREELESMLEELV